MGARPTTATVTLNEVRRVKVTFTDENGDPVAPGGNVTYRQIQPDGTDNGGVTGGHTNPSTGIYYRDVTLNAVGTWRFGYSADIGACEGLITVTSILS